MGFALEQPRSSDSRETSNFPVGLDATGKFLYLSFTTRSSRFRISRQVPAVVPEWVKDLQAYVWKSYRADDILRDGAFRVVSRAQPSELVGSVVFDSPAYFAAFNTMDADFIVISSTPMCLEEKGQGSPAFHNVNCGAESCCLSPHRA